MLMRTMTYRQNESDIIITTHLSLRVGLGFLLAYSIAALRTHLNPKAQATRKITRKINADNAQLYYCLSDDHEARAST